MDETIDQYQQEVIDQKWNSKIAVSAGPGTGKSFTAALRVASIISQLEAAPDNSDALVVCLTFTNAATDVTKERLMNQNVVAGVEVRTIDSWCAKLRDLASLEAQYENSGYDKNITQLIAHIKNSQNFEFPSDIAHIVIDEAQDIYGVRLELLNLLLATNLIEGWTVLGDPAQAIYEYGSEGDEGSFLESLIVNGKFDKYLNLEIDHRSKTDKARKVRILGSELRNQNPSEQGIEHIWREYLDTQSLTISQLVSTAMGYNESGQSVGVLLRTNRQMIELSTKLSQAAVEHHCSVDSGNSSLPAWIADLDDANEKEEVLSRAPSYINQSALSKLFERWCQGGLSKRISIEKFSDSLHQKRVPQLLLKNDPKIISLTTVHRAKGLEYQKVIVGLDIPVGIDLKTKVQEARVLFVALTRSQESIVRLNVDGIKTNSRRNKQTGRWVDLAFKGRNTFTCGLEVKMEDFIYLYQPSSLKPGDSVAIRNFKQIEGGVWVFGAYEQDRRDPFAILSQDFSNAVQKEFSNRGQTEFLGLHVSGFSSIPIPKGSRDSWTQKYLAKVPYMAGMVHPANKE